MSGIRTQDPSNQPAKTHASDRTATVTGYEALIDEKTTVKDLYRYYSVSNGIYRILHNKHVC
jgi:hypothetical protein